MWLLITSAAVQTPSETSASSGEGKRFSNSHLLKLPAEIRLLIYKELLVQSQTFVCAISEDANIHEKPDFILGTKTSYPCTSTHMLKNDRSLQPAILRVCRQIYYEAQSILTSKNAFQRVWRPLITTESWECENFGLGRSLSSRATCLNEPANTNSLHHHVQLLGISICIDVTRNPRFFPTLWAWLEPRLLALYSNLSWVQLRICHADIRFEFCVNLWPKIKLHHEVREQQYRIQLATILQEIDPDSEMIDGDPLGTIGDLCDEIVLSKACGSMENTAFGVADLEWFGRTVYLGCDVHATSQDQIAEIFQNRASRALMERMLSGLC